jgi:predicted metal-dependent phosphoesterase TrpH
VTTEPPTFDLQSHSLHSDGALRPREVVKTAAAAGVELLALSDHDTVDGVDEALDAAKQHGLALVTAVEISAVDRTEGDLHILGYAIDHRDPLLLERLHDYRGDRERRAHVMAAALGELGFELDARMLEQREAEHKSIGRPHLAQAVVAHSANAPRLHAEGLLDPSAFLEAYLIPGRPAFRARTSPSVAEAIDVIHAAGGVAVWAHPFWDVERPTDVLDAIDRFRAIGVDGVECFYATHSQEQTDMLANRCAELGLLTTGSSDFHGPHHREFSRFRAFSTYGHVAALGPIAPG